MLKLEDAVGFKWYKPPGNNRYRIYIFECKKCKGEVVSRKSYLAQHSGNCRACAAKESIKSTRVHVILRPYEAKYNAFKKRCPETDVSYEEYLVYVGKDCHYCDRVLLWTPHGENNPGFWLDRKNNNIGHLKYNMVVCCGPCNNTKRDYFTYEEFMLMAPTMKRVRIERELRQRKKAA
jgi:hypothetical protein